ncbi:MAG: hypothetical protein ACE5OP_01630 [Candidatus Glassbacteria bacterium]
MATMITKKNIIVLVLILALFIVIVIFVYPRYRHMQSTCEVCGRQQHAHSGYTLFFRNGEKKTMCCAKCGVRKQMAVAGEVQRAETIDFISKEKIDASKAFFVEGSDVNPCTDSVPGYIQDRYGSGLYLCYDICTPGLLAFESHPDAVTFQRAHGGRITTLESLLKE